MPILDRPANMLMFVPVPVLDVSPGLLLALAMVVSKMAFGLTRQASHKEGVSDPQDT